ncbi:PREDICTED: reverse mRNAase, partial [Prunus dulcis]
VTYVMDMSTGTWNLDSIKRLISEEEVAAIVRVPIGSTAASDRLIWLWEKLGKYTAKSGYHWLHVRSTRRGRVGTSSSSSIDPGIWKLIWETDCPHKIRNFLWRALRNGLATNESLLKRKSISSSTCSIYSSGVESVEHVLLLCPWALVWFGSSLNIRICRNEITTLNGWFHDILFHDGLGKVDRARIASSLTFTY